VRRIEGTLMGKLSGVEARELRMGKLQRLVRTHGAVPLAEAADKLQVSAMTVRRDLATDGAGLVCLGGFVVGQPQAGAPRYTLDAERDRHAANKRLACRRAAELVRDGDSLFIDCGSTMPHLAEALPEGIALDVVCYSMNIAAVLSRRPRTQLMLLGGVYHPSSDSFSSDEALQYLRRLGVAKAFLSAGGVHAERGASCSNFHEVAVKQAAIESAAESFLLVDESKLDRLKPASFSPLESFTHIIVGGRPAASWRPPLRKGRVEFIG
jgi:DeoR family deoxyribose operon repressor